MNNYQLYKTNVLLSGQVQWDIIIGISNGVLYVKDFHLSPVSNYVPYNKLSDENLLNYEHRYNLKDFYKKISGYFYTTPVNHYMTNDWPLIDSNITPYDDTYFAGCKRIEYDIYKKPFGYLCPIWLEYLPSDQFLTFDINIKTGDNQIASKMLTFDYNQMDSHNKFIDYFKTYISYLNINNGCDDVININLSKQVAYLKGIDVTTGNLNICDISNIVQSLMSRERPLMEFDSIITNSYMNTNTIVPNLFNFNICFDVQDILTGGISAELEGKPVYFSIDVGTSIKDVNNLYSFTGFEKTDIYTNFSYIPKKYCGVEYNIVSDKVEQTEIPSDAPNVLDYLKDDRYLEFMNKNKTVQKICHWQLVDNKDYIFNLYNGFAGYSNEGNMSHRYADTPDINQGKYSSILNNIGWANLYNLDFQSYMYIVNNYPIFKENNLATKICKGWNTGLYYNVDEDKYVYVILGYIKSDEKLIYSTVNGRTSIEYSVPNENSKILINCLGLDKDLILICSSNKDLLTFANISKVTDIILNDDSIVGNNGQIDNETYFTKDSITLKADGTYNWNVSDGSVNGSILLLNESKYMDGESVVNLAFLNKLLKSVKQIPLVVLNKSLFIIFADGPSLSVNEVEYYKNDNPDLIYILRYDGKIKPCFGYGYNELFYKKCVTESDQYNPIIKYSNSGYAPLYKSIGYYSYESEKLDYENPIFLIKDNLEYKWFNNNKYIHLPGNLSFELTINENKNNVSDINVEINKYLINYFSINDNTAQYINTKYNIKYDLLSFNNNNFLYKITMNLK